MAGSRDQQQQQQLEGDAELHDDSASEHQPLLASGGSSGSGQQSSQEQQQQPAEPAAAEDAPQQQEQLQQQKESGSSKDTAASEKQQDSGQCRCGPSMWCKCINMLRSVGANVMSPFERAITDAAVIARLLPHFLSSDFYCSSVASSIAYMHANTLLELLHVDLCGHRAAASADSLCLQDLP
jgi:hypothetical protein